MEEQIKRVAQMLGLGMSEEDVRSELLKEDKSEADIYLLISAARLYLKWFGY